MRICRNLGIISHWQLRCNSAICKSKCIETDNIIKNSEFSVPISDPVCVFIDEFSFHWRVRFDFVSAAIATRLCFSVTTVLAV